MGIGDWAKSPIPINDNIKKTVIKISLFEYFKIYYLEIFL